MSGHRSDVGNHLGPFADDLLARELPDLPADRRAATVEFVVGRARMMPAPLRLGVTVVAAAAAVVRRRVGSERSTAFFAATTLPVLGELARLVRSLGYAYVWETWPSTTPTGAST